MAKYCIGIDLGGTYVKFGLLDSHRRASPTFQLPTAESPDGIVKQMIGGARKLIQDGGLNKQDIVAVGIGSPGPLNLADGIIVAMPNIPGMDNLPVRDLVAEGLGMPAALENDANAAAYGEYLCGAGRGAGDMVLLTLGTGVGSGVILDGKILHGVHGAGGEIGHMIVQPGGEQCGCGQRGCLEQYCSATYMAQRAKRLIQAQGRTSTLASKLEQAGSIDSKDIQDAAIAGDQLAYEIWDQCAYYLAMACVNICRIFDPDLIVLGGGMARAGDDLMSPMMRHFEGLHWSLTAKLTRIGLAKLGNDAGAIGAAGVAWAMFGKQ